MRLKRPVVICDLGASPTQAVTSDTGEGYLDISSRTYWRNKFMIRRCFFVFWFKVEVEIGSKLHELK